MAICPVPAGSLVADAVVSEDGPLEAGSAGLTLTCTVHETISGLTNTPSAHWMTSSGPVSSGEDITVTETFRNATTATATLTFSSLHTSHAGLYTCQGTLVSPAAVYGINSTTDAVSVTVSCKCGQSCLYSLCHEIYSVCMYVHTVPTPAVALSVPSGPLYEGTSQTLTCTVTLPDTVDTDVTVTVHWTPDTTSDRVSISPVSSMRSPFISTLTLSPLSMTDATQYSCMATADSASQFITASAQRQSLVETITVTGIGY